MLIMSFVGLHKKLWGDCATMIECSHTDPPNEQCTCIYLRFVSSMTVTYNALVVYVNYLLNLNVMSIHFRAKLIRNLIFLKNELLQPLNEFEQMMLFGNFHSNPSDDFRLNSQLLRFERNLLLQKCKTTTHFLLC